MLKKIGEIGVDAGLCWIGDPCYILHKHPEAKDEHDRPPKDIGEDWSDFCDRLGNDREPNKKKQFNYDGGHAGLGVCVPTGWGDGTYDVMAEYGTGEDEGRIKRIVVEFIPDLDEDDNDFFDEEDDFDNYTLDNH